ncbi:Cytochrome C oxidase, cbb3-type, subunit III [Belliella buryatensis]|uniref:Cytochrome C oxidase, cbb3-type, subunit III n=1 Tax=Belliella buryatensis TaxID=1500549 RepID=A0A239G8D5_9BACT|nr:cytochrome c [Belliella buryatensis]SNS64972.1 Cytochrome C oxidase, cbb3-type, subunit III [Belliella buryatensis]
MKLNLGITISFLILTATSCGTEKDPLDKGLSDIKDSKVMQYAIEGKILYENYCANCHQTDGIGLGKLIPPLRGSDYMLEDIGRTVHIIKYGLKGEIIVNDQKYNQPMPANPQLTNMEIAQIVTYLYNIWGSNKGVIDSKEIENYLTK